MKSRIGTIAGVWLIFAGCSAGAEGDLPPGADEAVNDATGLDGEDVSTAPGAATGCPSVTTTLAEHAAVGRVTDVPVQFFIFTFHTYYSTHNPQQVLGNDPNQRVTLYRGGWGFTTDAALCVGTSLCTDGIVQAPETCDGTNFGGATCATRGYLGGGTLSCITYSCEIDDSGCQTGCNNGALEPRELCDVPGQAAPNHDCTDYGFASGTLKCSADCHEDLSECVPSVCGNGIREADEDCDGAAMGPGVTCETYWPGQYEGGTLGCGTECRYDPTGCRPICGNGRLDSGELCEGTVFGPTHAGKTCADVQFAYPTWPFPTLVNYQSGNLDCNSVCNVDISACKPIPGCYSFVFKGRLFFQCY